MNKLIITSMMLILAGCAATESSQDRIPANKTHEAKLAPERVYFNGMSNELATDALLVSLMNKNYMVKKIAPTSVGVQLGNHQFVLQPSLNPNGIDRILASRYYSVSPKLQGSQDLMAMLLTLNDKLNFAKFTLRENGKVIQVQGAATFVDTLELEELRRFLIWTDDALEAVGKAIPANAYEFIKPLPVMPISQTN
ncbi:hypothetical protein K0I73_17395 [Shewanella mesophila]|uniref:YbjN domain-containing protein n=1 Tax=Shewanella mesophila TaxID=2864208 RepID=UPI001C65CB05|nr:YbjN domain-containing protein [Shewanella mesophila]QYJ85915.1 hypothetical protein K0I73_17395 [Shewanella mesophila]